MQVSLQRDYVAKTHKQIRRTQQAAKDKSRAVLHCLPPERERAAAWFGEMASLNTGKKGFTLNTLQCEIMLKSGFGFVKAFHAHSSDGVW